MNFNGKPPTFFKTNTITLLETGIITGLDRYIEPVPWVRPTEWLTLPELSPNEQKFVGLFSVVSGGNNYLTLNAAGRYCINWGDGTSGEFTSTSTNTKLYDYNSITGSILSDGSKQLIVSLYPISGDNLTTLNFQQRATDMGSKTYPENWLDMKMSLPLITSFTLGGNNKYHAYVKNVDIVSLNTGLNTIANLFLNFYSLEKFTLPSSGLSNNITNISAMFNNCYNIQNVPAFNVSGVTNASNLFLACRNLLEVGPFKFYNLNNASQMFSTCASLRKITSGFLISGSNISMNSFLNSSSVLESYPDDMFSPNVTYSNIDSMFRSAICLLNFSPNLNFSGITSSASSAFNNCQSLQKLPNTIDLSTITNLGNFFNGCLSITGYPNLILNHTGVFDANQMYITNFSLFEVTSGMLHFPNAGSVSSILNNCFSLKNIPWFNAPNATTGTSIFSSCGSLKNIDYLNLASLPAYANIFSSCNSLQTIRSGIFNPTATYTNTFTSLPSLSWVNISGIGETISFAGCAFQTGGLVNIFNNLRTVVGKTITVSNNPGASSLTTGQIAIATSKGWTVVT